jgi:amidase
MTLSSDVCFRDATWLAEAIVERALSSTDVVEACLGQIERYNGEINAVVTLDAESARAAAKKADQLMESGAFQGPLAGVPVTIKDAFETSGMRTTSGLLARAGHVPDRDATVVARLKAAGAIVLGKTNLPELLSGCHCCNPLFGRTNNPWDRGRTPGGSSGGSAASVASGMAALDVGSDIKGSIRTPAHFCGVCGLKPTDFMVSSAGHIPGTPRGLLRYLISIGPLARSVRDLRLALSVIAGPDGRLHEVPPTPQATHERRKPGQLRLAITEELPGLPVTDDIKEALHETRDRLAKAGCTVLYTMPQKLDGGSSIKTSQEIEMSAIYARAAPLHIPRAVWQDVSRYVKNNPFLEGSYAGAGANLMTYARALGRRDACITRVERFLADLDGWICPVASVTALPHADLECRMEVVRADVEIGGKRVPYDVATFGYTSIFNLTGSPVVTVPATITREGLPAGIQIVGRRWDDYKLLDVAETIADIIGPAGPPPGFA